ncbi:MAG: hypothetical protein R2724_19235 [Bryobacterales bacterium]
MERRAINLARVVLPTPGGPQNHRPELVALDLVAQRLAGREQVLLADVFVERARPHALGERPREIDFVGVSGWGIEQRHYCGL